eukprot:357329-Chlamydomonas_euryale.AAC.7
MSARVHTRPHANASVDVWEGFARGSNDAWHGVQGATCLPCGSQVHGTAFEESLASHAAARCMARRLRSHEPPMRQPGAWHSV